MKNCPQNEQKKQCYDIFICERQYVTAFFFLEKETDQIIILYNLSERKKRDREKETENDCQSFLFIHVNNMQMNKNLPIITVSKFRK